MDVLLFSSTDDPHATVVAEVLVAAGAAVEVGDLAWFAQSPLTVVPGEFFDVAGVRVDAGSSIWFRRVGAVADVAGMDALEARLRREELDALVFGGLDASHARWVDHPQAVTRAEGKLWQLQLARSLGVPTPDTLVTSDVSRAAEFAAGGEVLAKAASSGQGLAPYAQKVSVDDLGRVSACPTLLQRPVDAVANVRVVVVGQQGFVWRRGRGPAQQLDGRAADAAGAGFALVEDEDLTQVAVSVSCGLGLSMTVQDWVDDGTRCWFLEANPVGQWLFLDGAAELVAPSLAQLLLGEPS